MIALGTHVPSYGKISAVRMGEMEREYLLIDSRGVVSWLSEYDIKAILEVNSD